MSTYTETIHIADREITVTAESPFLLDLALSEARRHWRTDASKHLPKNPAPADPWPTS